MFTFILGMFLGSVVTFSINTNHLYKGACVRELGTDYYGVITYNNFDITEVRFSNNRKIVYDLNSSENLIEVSNGLCY